MRTLYAAVIGGAALAGSQFAVSTPAEAKWCFKICAKYVYTLNCKWVGKPPRLVCTPQQKCERWLTYCLPSEIEIDRLPHEIPVPPPDLRKQLFRLPKPQMKK
jgi:hypothetical protein